MLIFPGVLPATMASPATRFTEMVKQQGRPGTLLPTLTTASALQLPTSILFPALVPVETNLRNRRRFQLLLRQFPIPCRHLCGMVKCRDTAGNETGYDYWISFMIAGF